MCCRSLCCRPFVGLFVMLVGVSFSLNAGQKPDEKKPAEAKPAAEKAKTPNPAVGIWEGKLKVNSIELRLVFKITEADGKVTAKLDSPDQSQKDIPLDSGEIKNGKLLVSLKAAKASFEGVVSEDGTMAVGEWKQGGMSFPLTMKKVTKASAANRPQLPKKPYGYPTEEVTFENPTAKIKLAGTLSLPPIKGPYPAVVLVSGSGPQDRDETLFEHKPFLVIADHFAKKGIAVLRYDDRGVAKSGGKFAGATSADFATDAYAAVQYLKSRPEIDGKRIGIVGHSEGGLIGPMVAAQHPDDLGFIVMLAGPGMSGMEVMKAQSLDVMKTLGEKAETMKLVSDLNEHIMPMIQKDLPTEEHKKKITAEIKAYVAKLTEDQKKQIELDKDEKGEKVATMVNAMFEPWMNYFLKYDPRTSLKKVKCPVLALNGEFDVQVRAKENLDEIAKSLKAGGNSSYKTQMIPGTNHLFQPTKTGAVTEYGRIELTMEPAVLTLMSDWILGLK